MNGFEKNERKVLRRIIDANANRCAEGLRVIEDIARFSMEDKQIQRELKQIRHRVRQIIDDFDDDIFQVRDSFSDVGRDSMTLYEGNRGSLREIARANFARSEEALRAMEEFFKLANSGIANIFKQLRFELYSVEKKFFTSKVKIIVLPAKVPFLYGILDRSVIRNKDVRRVTGDLLEGGVSVIQYRAKGLSLSEQRKDLSEIIPMAGNHGAPVIVNDDPELAAEMWADGVHLGMEDQQPDIARKILGPDAIIGISVHTLDELEEFDREYLDYVAVGSIFPSPTKSTVPVVGLNLLMEIKKRVNIPVVAIGGINKENVEGVINAGADGIASISYLLKGDITRNCFTFIEIIDRKNRDRGN